MTTQSPVGWVSNPPLSAIHGTRLLLASALLWFGLAVAAFAQSPGPLQGTVFGSGKKALVVVLHGDVSKGGPADYHYRLAQRIAQANRDVTVLALLRPGYSDSRGLKSKGSHNGRRDHYTKRNNTLVAQTIAAMAKQVGTRRVVAVGHSGGAAQVGGVLGLSPGLISSAVLVSCPCNIAKWRSMRGRKPWSKSQGQSPHRMISRIAPGTRITLIVGGNDKNTFAVLSQDYAAAAKARGLPVAYVPVAGAGHGFGGLQATVLSRVNAELR